MFKVSKASSKYRLSYSFSKKEKKEKKKKVSKGYLEYPLSHKFSNLVQ